MEDSNKKLNDGLGYLTKNIILDGENIRLKRINYVGILNNFGDINEKIFRRT